MVLYHAAMPHWQLANDRRIDLARPAVIGILNATPDSFADGGRHNTVETALRAAEAFVGDGAVMIDIGGESTKPGSQPVRAEEQLTRVLPILQALRGRRDFDSVAISIDTTRAQVARIALEHGADAVNDVSGFQDDRAPMLELLSATRAGYVLMHRLAAPAEDRYSDQYAEPPRYRDVVADVRHHLTQWLFVLRSSGVVIERIAIDPGLGFGKSVEQNLELIRRTDELLGLGCPVLSGISRKSFVGRCSLGRDSQPGERLEGTLALSVIHYLAGARLFRVHDVGPCVRALRAAEAASGGV